MSRAFVLLNSDLSDLDSARDLLSALKKVDGVVGVYLVYGNYDAIVELETEPARLNEIILSRIRPLEHVTSSLTLIAA